MDITWTPERAKVADLKLWQENPRTISEKEYNDLKASITKRGFHDVLKVNTDLTVLSGNMRKRALEELGITEVFIMKPSRELTLDEMIVVALESNRHRGEDDWDALANMDKDLLLEAGFDKLEMAKEFDLRMPIEDDEPPEPKEDHGVKLGDLFQLGSHRLLCGDATKKEDVERLMDGQKADMVFTDPPYGVDYEGKTKDSLKIENDKDTATFSKSIPLWTLRGGGYSLRLLPGGQQLSGLPITIRGASASIIDDNLGKKQPSHWTW